MPTKFRRRTFGNWYLSNLFGWVIGTLGGFDLAVFYLLPWAQKNLSPSTFYRFSDAFQLLFPLLMLIVSVGLVQLLKLRQWEVRFDIYKWIVANIKGAFIAFVVLVLIGGLVGKFQRPILNLLYGNHTYGAQTPFIFSFISAMVPLLGSIGTSIMIAIDVFGWKFGKSDLVE